MTREDLAVAISHLGAGSIQVISTNALVEAFGKDVGRGAAALAAEYGCEFRIDERSGEGTFEKRVSADAADWAEHEKIAVEERHPELTVDNAISGKDQREHRTPRKGDAANRPLEMGGEAENPHPREGSMTDPDAG